MSETLPDHNALNVEMIRRAAHELELSGPLHHPPTGRTLLPSTRPAGEFAAVAAWAVADAAAHLAGEARPKPLIDVGLTSASLVGFAVQRLNGGAIPRLNDTNPYVDLYQCEDGRWIQLHGGLPTLRERTSRVLGIADQADATDIARACRTWESTTLEESIAAARGCAAVVRTHAEWIQHPHGAVVNALPAVVTSDGPSNSQLRWQPQPVRPLRGLRVLDITRILAGPTIGRTLAALGADVLNVRGPHLPSIHPYVVDTGHGKRSAFANLDDPKDLAALKGVAEQAHVVIDGNRPGTLRKYGLDASRLLEAGSFVHVTVNCFGPEGPWADRAGMEQIAQACAGLAAPDVPGERPALVPAAAVDYTTGYLGTVGVLRAITDILERGGSRRVAVSLAQTATRLAACGRRPELVNERSFETLTDHMLTTATAWGTLEHLPPAIAAEGLDIRWTIPPAPLGFHDLCWAEDDR